MILPWWQTQFWFPLMLKMSQDFPLQLPSNLKLLILHKQTSNAPIITKDEAASCSIMRETLRNSKIPDNMAEIITVSWRRTPHSKYEAIIKKWKQHALSRDEDLIDTSAESVLSFCTLKSVYIVRCVELGVPYLVLYTLRDFQSFQTIQ